jgi:hypothetical protein
MYIPYCFTIGILHIVVAIGILHIVVAMCILNI